MGIIEELDEFNKRWEVSDNSTYQEEFGKFRTRILNSFKNIDSELLPSEVENFCNILGITCHAPNYGDIIKTLTQTNKEKKFYYVLQVLCLLPVRQQKNHSTGIVRFNRTKLINRIAQSIDLSKVNLRYILNGENLILHPKGEKILDDKLVSAVISYLNPESNKHFIDALKFYEASNHIKSAESLRRTLEEFLRYKLSNSKGLDANISELQSKLKAIGKDSRIRNIISQTFNHLDKYFNVNSKHDDGEIDEIENEYLIYQVGLLLRYIQRS